MKVLKHLVVIFSDPSDGIEENQSKVLEVEGHAKCRGIENPKLLCLGSTSRVIALAQALSGVLGIPFQPTPLTMGTVEWVSNEIHGATEVVIVCDREAWTFIQAVTGLDVTDCIMSSDILEFFIPTSDRVAC